MAVLIGMSAEVKGQTHELGPAGLTIGRNTDNTIAINNPTVSGHHCAISLQDSGEFMLKDLGSTNGTRVNSQEITESILKSKDLVHVGSVEFLFSSVEIPYSEAEAIYNKTEVVEATGPVSTPESFSSISPFGARRREDKGAWTMAIAGTAAVAFLVTAYFLFRLFTMS